jgi:catechol O-methyltransferase
MQQAQPASTNLRIWSLEMNPGHAAIATQLIALAGLSSIVSVVVGPAEESLRKLTQENKLVALDMLFLDHVEALYVEDFKRCEELGLIKEGVVVVAE